MAQSALAIAPAPVRLPLLTTSAARTYRACPRSYLYSYELGYRSAASDPNLRFGTLGHRGLEAWWLEAQRRPSTPNAWLAAALRALDDAPDSDEYERAKAAALLAGYDARWADEDLEVLAVEAEFDGPLVNPSTGASSKTWGFGGKIDAVVRVGASGRVTGIPCASPGDVYLVEHKTSSEDISRGSDYWRRLTLDPQVSNYLAGARMLGFEPRGVIYDVIGKPDKRPLQATPVESRRYRKKDGALDARQRDRDETPEEYFDRIIAALEAEPDRYFQRGEIVRLDDELAEGARDLWQIGVQIRESRRERVWPRNPDACRRYGRECAFLPVCIGTASLEDATRFRKVERVNEELGGAGEKEGVR